MPPLRPHSIRQKAEREARLAGALRANLVRRKEQQRLQGLGNGADIEAAPASTPADGTVDGLEPGLAPKGSHR